MNTAGHPKSPLANRWKDMTRQMEEKKENKLLDDIRGHITVVDELPFHIADDDPFLVRKLEEAYKTLKETPIPEFILKRMTEKD